MCFEKCAVPDTTKKYKLKYVNKIVYNRVKYNDDAKIYNVQIIKEFRGKGNPCFCSRVGWGVWVWPFVGGCDRA